MEEFSETKDWGERSGHGSFHRELQTAIKLCLSCTSLCSRRVGLSGCWPTGSFVPRPETSLFLGKGVLLSKQWFGNVNWWENYLGALLTLSYWFRRSGGHGVNSGFLISSQAMLRLQIRDHERGSQVLEKLPFLTEKQRKPDFPFPFGWLPMTLTADDVHNTNAENYFWVNLEPDLQGDLGSYQPLNIRDGVTRSFRAPIGRCKELCFSLII